MSPPPLTPRRRTSTATSRSIIRSFPFAAQPPHPGGSLGDLFNRGDLIGGFAAGFLGSGVIGLLFGHGVVGELSGVAPVLGLLFQLALIAMLVRLIWTWWHDDAGDAFAELSPRQLADAYGHARRTSAAAISIKAPTLMPRPARPRPTRSPRPSINTRNDTMNVYCGAGPSWQYCGPD